MSEQETPAIRTELSGQGEEWVRANLSRVACASLLDTKWLPQLQPPPLYSRQTEGGMPAMAAWSRKIMS